MYARTELASGFTLAILSPITVATNLLLITAIFKDPLKYFKKPTSHFLNHSEVKPRPIAFSVARVFPPFLNVSPSRHDWFIG